MGDRGNICIKEGIEEVWLYTHWGGSGIREVVRTALAKRLRWNNAPYLARIIFDVLTDGSHGEETGFGIWSSICDNGHEPVIVNVETQKVRIGDRLIPVAEYINPPVVMKDGVAIGLEEDIDD